ncbi:pali-domain-containing protein [Dendrothele bispora CBS 962.96]|uniref:Pali-domain-containing protein n=1 Tax=Dendrothele bispora (strain CBS 962.96) TaxID=1314807 RepID=A0A4S8KVP9_DENBC|nr:pali-domain-containing protein [Dendrothele bispora CBS 962.96]
MSRVFCIPGIIFLFCAFVLSFLVSISTPFLPALDIARVHFENQQALVFGDQVTETRFGIWSPCSYSNEGARTCQAAGHGYSVSISNLDRESVTTIGSSWTRGLAVHPVATAVIFIALCLSLSTHVTVTLISSLTSFLAALLTLIAFAIDIALFVFVRHETRDVADIGANTNTAPGFWLTFVSLLLCLLAGCTVCFGRRRDRMSDASYPAATTETKTRRTGFLARFRRRN